MSIAPPKKMIRRRKRRGKVRGARRLPPPPNAPKTKRSTEAPEALRGAPKTIGERPSKRKGGAVPRTIQGLHGQMEEWMAEAFTKMGAPELIGEIPWQWNSRLTATMGQAHYRWVDGKTKPLKMSFSPRLFKRASEGDQRETVFHECAHIVDYHKGTYTKGAAHGASWKRYMRRAGVTPKRCHTVMPVGRVEVWCLCRTHYVTKKMRGKIKGGKVMRCRYCKSKVSWVKPRD